MSASVRIGEHVRRNAIGYVALFVALSGTSYAATKVGTKNIKKNAIVSSLIKDGEVGSADIADNGLTGADINEATLQGIPAQPLGAGSVGATQLADGAVTIPKLADLAVTTAKLADGAATSLKIADGTIVDGDIAAAAAIDDAKLGQINDPGKVADAALSANVARLNQANQTFAAPLAIDGDTDIAVDGASEQFQVAATRGAAGFTENMLLTLTNNSTGGGQDIAELANAAGTSATESILRLNNLDPDTAATDGLVVESLAGGITTAVDASDPEVGTALEIGNNDLKTSAATISAAELEKLDGSPIRSINLPLPGFTILGTGAPDFNSGAADALPDFINLGFAPTLEFDVTGTPDSNGARVGTNVLLPADYEDGGAFRVRVSKPTDTGATDGLACQLSVDGNNVSGTNAIVTGTAIQTIDFFLPTPRVAGESAGFSCNTSPTDDAIRLHGVEFQYLATR